MMTTSRLRSRHPDGTQVLLSLTLSRAAREPLGRQLYLQISEYIRTGRLVGGTRLTSTRKLALDLDVSRAVTLAAYGQLATEGYIEARRGSGQYVRLLDNADCLVRARPGRRQESDDGKSKINVTGRPFDPTSQIEGIFPQETWARLLGRGWRIGGKEAQSQENWAGIRSLREATARYVYALRGIECTYEHVLVTFGNSDALQIIVDAFAPTTADKKAGAWVEDPGHVGARNVLLQKGVRLVPVPVDECGIDVAKGCHLAGNARFALVTPSRQFPLGMPLSLARRLALVGWARQSGAILIEDDYDTEIRFSGHPIPSMLSLDPSLKALSLGSFSKLTFPGLRLGYIVGARPLIRRMLEVRERSGSPVATSAQPALAALLDEGAFAKHLRSLRREVAARRDTLVTALNAQLHKVLAILPQEVGMHLTVTLKHNMRQDTHLAAKATRAGLNLDPLSAHYYHATRRNGFLLGYAGWSQLELMLAADDLVAFLC